MIFIRHRQKLFAQMFPFSQFKIPDSAHLISSLAAIQMAPPDGRMPSVMPVKIAQDFPNRLNRCINDSAAADRNQLIPPSDF